MAGWWGGDVGGWETPCGVALAQPAQCSHIVCSWRLLWECVIKLLVLLTLLPCCLVKVHSWGALPRVIANDQLAFSEFSPM